MAVVLSSDFSETLHGVPLTHACIGYKNLVPASTVTTSSSSASFPADSVKRQTTWEKWRPGSLPATLTIDLGASNPLSYLGLGAHTFGSSGNTLLFERSLNGSDWNEIATDSPAENSAVLLMFNEVAIRYIRITVSGGIIPSLGVAYAGTILAMERPIYSGHTPITLSRTTTVRPTESEKGQWLGRSIVRSGLSTSYDWPRLKSAWYRTNFDPFVMAARTKPFFIAWNPQDFPQETVLGWTGDDISPTNSGPRDLMSVSIGVSAYAHE